MTRDEAEAHCNTERNDATDENETYVPILAEIHSSDEQRLLEEYIFEKMQVIDDIWVRAKRGLDNRFYWNEKTEVTYSNWAPHSPSESVERECVSMGSGLSRKEQTVEILNYRYMFVGDKKNADIKSYTVGK
jgi:hypothetical protein